MLSEPSIARYNRSKEAVCISVSSDSEKDFAPRGFHRDNSRVDNTPDKDEAKQAASMLQKIQSGLKNKLGILGSSEKKI